MMQRCQPIEEVAGKQGKHNIDAHTANAEIFWKCSDKMDTLIKAVKSQQNSSFVK